MRNGAASGPASKAPKSCCVQARAFRSLPEIDVAPKDIIVDKTCNGAFTYTDFEHVLRAQGITHLLFSGCTTDVCVHTTLREACDRNFQCLTISDACASGDQTGA